MLDFLKHFLQRTPRDPRTISGKPLSPQAEAWLYRTSDGQPLTAAARAFIEGETSSLTAADIDPVNSAAYAHYSQALALKQQGDLSRASQLLEASCDPPSIYKGHYRLLFQILRQFNRTDLKEHRYQPVVERVTHMIRYDDEMIAAMLAHWSRVQNTILTPQYFDGARNLKVSDVKALLMAATALSRDELVTQANRLLQRF